MTNKELIQKIYLEDGIRDSETLEKYFHQDIVLEWTSSDGDLVLHKNDIIKISKELFSNYSASYIDITHLIEQDNQVVIRYNHKVATIENPDEIMLIAKFIVIWEFENGKIIKGYQISQPL
ncbi:MULTISPECIES: nuclear transport factor 2 family protein [Flavobacterium]|uniref:Nuclear transport factor 2 family protein n=1 Tax=Flavobacterium jumunjinense TaxID=998845 RepID=A0ABV5GMN4_9FLAO|nr:MULTISPECIES: nuclear transport factor 2 family protein [Flavobacterium]